MPDTPEREEDFFTTRRIDIPPDLRDQIDQVRGAPVVGPETRRQKIIRVPKTQVGVKPLGSPDFQELLQNIYDAVLITDTAGRIFGANVRAVQFLLRDVADLCRHNILDFISGAAQDLLQTIQQTLQNDRFVLIQAYCARQDGSFFPAEISVNRLPLSQQEYLSFFIRDVTVRKAQENELRTGYNAIQNASSGILIADANGYVQYANAATCRFWRIENKEALVGRHLRDLLPDSGFFEKLMERVRRGETLSGELQMVTETGDALYAQISAAPNFDTEGDFAGVVLSVLDISDLKRVQKQIEEYAAELQKKNLEMEDDLRMAREVQMAFLPREIHTFPAAAPAQQAAVHFTTLYLPSGLVGGDFYDIIPLSDSRVGVLIADVVGHGMRAALVVATLRGLIEQLIHTASEPAEFLTRLNEAYARVFRQTSDRMFATMFYGAYDTQKRRLAYSSAGHLPPFVLRRQRKQVQVIEPTGVTQGAAIGLYDNSSYGSGVAEFDSGDTLLLYTDGLSESLNDQNEYFETQAMPASLQAHVSASDEDILQALVAEARQFSGRADFEDDVCLLAVRFGASGS